MIVEATRGTPGSASRSSRTRADTARSSSSPETQSQEKKDTLRLCGATLYEVPAVPFREPNHYVHVAGRLAEQLARTEPNGAIWAQQLDNVANRQRHRETTGPEVREQTGGKIDAFICAVGTGGTLAGVAAALRERSPRVKIGLVDPPGAALQLLHVRRAEDGRLVHHRGHRARADHPKPGGAHRRLRLPGPDAETVQTVFDLVEHEGLVLGSSGGINVAGAIRLARELGPGHTIVTAPCDSGSRYASRDFNLEFLRSKSLPVPRWLEGPPPPMPRGVLVS